MKEQTQLKFQSPTFVERLKGMLGVDFYRLFHTPLFYIFLAIAAIIPAMILGTMGMENPQIQTSSPALYTNVWNIIAADSPLYTFAHIGEYANMNMVFIFGGIMVSIFIGNDYRSGYVKQLFTTHPRKIDYMLSKSITCAFAMACMCITYLLGGIGGGLVANVSFEVNVGSLICAIFGKMLMSLGWASLYTFLNIIFRKYFGVSIASSFFFGTGLLIVGVASLVGNSPLLNVFLYGSSVYACLSSNLWTVLVCLLVSVAWFFAYNLLGAYILERSDVY